jgi:GntR family transcriptional regulator
MPEWAPGEYVYVQIADELEAEIEAGKPPPGSRLPSEAELVERFQVARPTVRQAIAELRERGKVKTLHGKGTVVL